MRGATIYGREKSFRFHNETVKQYSWRAVAGNGEEIARTTQWYSRRIDRDKAVKLLLGAEVKTGVVANKVRRRLVLHVPGGPELTLRAPKRRARRK